MSAGPESQFIARFVNSVIKLTPFAGSGWVMVHFLLNEDWLKAVLMFPVMLITGAWAAYTGSFITASNERAGALGSQHGNSLWDGFGQLNRKVQWFFAKADNKFARAQANACQDYKAEGIAEMKWRSVPLLNEVYVPLGLRGGFGRGDFAGVGAELGARLPGGDADELALCLPKKVTAFQKLTQLPGVRPAWQGMTDKFGWAEALNEKLSNTDDDALYIWDLLRESQRTLNYHRLAIIARGGYGKTTLLRNIAYCYGTRPGQLSRAKRVPRLIPILLYLRDWRGVMAQADAPDLPTLIADHYLPKVRGGQRLNLDATWADKLLRQGNALVMIDGFDEVATDDCKAVGVWIDRAVSTYGTTARFVLTSRPVGYDRYNSDHGWTPIEVQPFTEDQRDDFLRRWYRCQVKNLYPGRTPEHIEANANELADDLIAQIDQRSALAKMADNPLLLVMIATVHKFHPTQKLPVERTKLYQRFLKMLLEDRPEYKGIDMALSAEQAQLVLQGVAWAMVRQDKIALPKAELADLVQALLPCDTDTGVAVKPKQFIRQVEEVSELFVRRESAEEYEFAHRSFQEYLAAMEVRKQGCEGALLGLEEEWRGATLLYAALVNPTTLIHSLIEQGGQTALDLAYDCWLENPTRVPDATFTALQEACYTQLEQYMVDGDWKAADQYTYRMLYQVLKKPHKSGFNPRELLNFPCEDLVRIDGLWVQHSQGKFGFSVQKDLWVECGGKLDGKWDFETYKKLSDRMGWRIDGKFRFDQISYELKDSSIPGHLPAGTRCGV
ncbi:MAG: GUN4 domain-containing protein [Cyanobacteria bacterium J06629_9]